MTRAQHRAQWWWCGGEGWAGGHSLPLDPLRQPGLGAAGAVGGMRMQDWPGPCPGRPARRAAGVGLLRGHRGRRAEKTPDAGPPRTATRRVLGLALLCAPSFSS